MPGRRGASFRASSDSSSVINDRDTAKKKGSEAGAVHGIDARCTGASRPPNKRATPSEGLSSPFLLQESRQIPHTLDPNKSSLQRASQRVCLFFFKGSQKEEPWASLAPVLFFEGAPRAVTS